MELTLATVLVPKSSAPSCLTCSYDCGRKYELFGWNSKCFIFLSLKSSYIRVFFIIDLIILGSARVETCVNCLGSMNARRERPPMKCVATWSVGLPLALAHSPSGCAIFCMAAGATPTGMETLLPRTVTEVSLSTTSLSTRGFNRSLHNQPTSDLSAHLSRARTEL